MFSQVKNSIANLRKHIHVIDVSSKKHKEWLPSLCNGLIWQLELCGITESLNADVLWDRSLGSGRLVTEVNSGKTEFRLYQALKDHQRWRGRQDSIHGKRVQNSQCFTDVIMCLPEDVWREDLNRTGGEIIKTTLHNLGWYHSEAFKQDLAPGRKPRYLVRLEPDLPKDRIKFLFGNGVYLPNDKDLPILHVILTLGDTPVASPVLNLLQDNFLPLKQPLGFYAGQERLLFTPEGQGPLSIQGWHGPAEAYLQILQQDENNWLASSDNGGRAKAWLRDGIWCFERRSSNTADEQVLSLKLAPATVAKDGGTVILNMYKYTLQFEALAMPQLSLVPGLSKWNLWLNNSGVLATTEQMQYEPNTLINLNFDDNGLHLCVPNEPPQLLGKKITESVAISNTGATLLPVDFPGRIGLLRFSTPTSYILDQETRILGRTDSDDKEFNPDIALDTQLAQPEALLWKANASNRVSTMASLGLSRKHATLRVEDGYLIMEPAKETCVLQPLTEDGGIKILENPNTAVNKMLRLEPGASVLIANCVLRFCIESA